MKKVGGYVTWGLKYGEEGTKELKLPPSWILKLRGSGEDHRSQGGARTCAQGPARAYH